MNRFHRWFCRSALWRRSLSETILPWALQDAELGQHILEVGPGPGLTTDILRRRFWQITSVEIDHRLADALRQRMIGTNVTVIEGDATAMPFADGSFTGAVSFTMLHHVPSRMLQDRLLAEVYRVLRSGGMFIGTDSRWSRSFQLAHLRDTMVIVNPDTFAARLAAAGFTNVSIDRTKGSFRFQARRA